MFRIFSALCVCLLVLLAGCQVDVTASAGGKMFYPKNIGKYACGDPREGMYNGSGYGESFGSGGTTGTNSGFAKLGEKAGGK